MEYWAPVLFTLFVALGLFATESITNTVPGVSFALAIACALSLLALLLRSVPERPDEAERDSDG
jgi:hypothetical protein